tara:strand:- start:629 stop:1249 length:621 start_codon:yes stop_codon:yes gene_type:complete
VSEELRRIEYNFYHWGPFVCHYKLLPKEIEEFKSLKNKKDFRYSLAGHLENEKTLDTSKVFKLLYPYLNSYIQGYFEYRGQTLATGFELKSAWINRQKKNEFNPPHTHDGHLSFVLYTEIPKGLHKECYTSVASSPGPGCITFDFNLCGNNVNKFFLQTHSHLPSVGDLFIFPAGLPHWVYPFKKTKGERVSISGNVELKGFNKYD